jgi:hypothetical protein
MARLSMFRRVPQAKTLREAKGIVSETYLTSGGHLSGECAIGHLAKVQTNPA